MGSLASKNCGPGKKNKLNEPKTMNSFEVTGTGKGFHTNCHIENSDFDVIATEPEE
jgi:hypothetical protein